MDSYSPGGKQRVRVGGWFQKERKLNLKAKIQEQAPDLRTAASGVNLKVPVLMLVIHPAPGSVRRPETPSWTINHQSLLEKSLPLPHFE